MCYAHGSIEQVTRTCVMCKVYPPRLGCPHQPLGFCRNRQNHPRFDVVHFQTAELDLFNGCGYCKWARKQQPSDKLWNNSGYPGCCRPPKSNEYGFIKSTAEWMAISVIHGVQIPSEILQKHVPPTMASSVAPPKHGCKKPNGKTSPITIHSPNEKDRYEKDLNTSMNIPSTSPPTGLSLSLMESSFTDGIRTPRRRSHKLPQAERNGDITMRTTSIRNIATPTTSTHPTHANCDGKTISKSSARTQGRRSLDDGTIRKRPSLVNLLSSSQSPSVSSSGSDPTSSRSGFSTATVTSDGFTDYLSDESDQELQRQAELRAAELEQAKQEKAEFDAALQTVRHLCLQPPPEWNNPTMGISRPKTNRNASLSSFQAPLLVSIGQSRP